MRGGCVETIVGPAERLTSKGLAQLNSYLQGACFGVSISVSKLCLPQGYEGERAVEKGVKSPGSVSPPAEIKHFVSNSSIKRGKITIEGSALYVAKSGPSACQG